MTPCGCRVTGNQHGSVFRPCDYHSRLIAHVCAVEDIEPSEFLDKAVREYVAALRARR